MKRFAYVSATFLVSALVVGAVLFAKYRSNLLTLAELTVKQPEQKRILERTTAAAACSKLQVEFETAAKSDSKPIKSKSSLSLDETGIYKAILRHWAAGDKTSVNVSNKTFPISLDQVSCECLKDIELSASLSLSHSFHDLPSTVLLQNMRLVDESEQIVAVRDNDPGKTIGKQISVEGAVGDAFAHGLFSMSEIVFDKEHLHAVVSYGFHCGLLCGSGATVVLEKVDSGWKITDRTCGGWVS